MIIWPPSRWGFLNIPATFEQPHLTAAPDTNSVRLQSSWTPLPLALGAAGAVPLTWAQRRLRRAGRRSVAERRSRVR